MPREICPACEGDPVFYDGTICGLCNGECTIDTPPPKVQTPPREPPEFFRGARISKSRKQQPGNS